MRFLRRPVLLPVLSLSLAVVGVLGRAAGLEAQEPTGVRLEVKYSAEQLPGLVVLPVATGAGTQAAATAVQGILRQDLDYSDRFQVRAAPAGSRGEPLNLALWKDRGADWVLDGSLAPRAGGLTLNLALYDAVYGQKKGEQSIALPPLGDPNFRMAVHAAADEVVRWATGEPGMAASRIAFVLHGRGSKEIYLVDSDGENVQRITSDGSTALSPAWGADGQRIAYTSFRSGRPLLYERDLRTGRDRVLSDREGLNITPAYSPDGRRIAFGTTVAGNTEVATYDRERNCCLQQQTRGQRFDSLSPTFSPDGSRIAFVSNRLGEPQVYVMELGGEPRLVSEHVYGRRGYNTSPDWSPSGSHIVYHSRVNGAFQLMVVDPAGRTRRALTNEGNNEDPSWAPDGRHVVFASSRDGGGLFVLDTVSGRVRPLLRGGGYGLPDWSRTLYRVAAPDAR